jgi:formylglycine-generating enzyme required for sulfatase activity
MNPDPLSTAALIELNKVCEAFKIAWRTGQRPRIDDYLGRRTGHERAAAFQVLLAGEIECRTRAGERPACGEYEARFPHFADLIKGVFERLERHDDAELLRAVTTEPAPRADEVTISAIDDPARLGSSDVTADHETLSAPPSRSGGVDETPQELPEFIGRYRVERLLGRGNFLVYLARDPADGRPVAIKLARAHDPTGQRRMMSLAEEAKKLEGLHHPRIVKLYEHVLGGEGAAHEGFIVLEYVEGQTLEDLLQSGRPDPRRLAAILAHVALAVHHAHIHSTALVHRDLKPSNILLDLEGDPHVCDFGLAVDEEIQRLRRGEVAGTLPYMAPEQVRGETHRLDGRTDIWALGVILYRGLTGKLPFPGRGAEEVFDEIQNRDPRPPRMADPSIDAELERICLRCLSRPMHDRYLTAADLAADLEHWLAGGTEPGGPITKTPVVPKGLLAFDVEDARFFLALLPGPRRGDGMPESIRFWKDRIEAMAGDKAFSVGLLYGHSGGGKSSFVKAGLLPNLDRGRVTTVYVEATPAGTEERLRSELRRVCLPLPEDAGLAELLAIVRDDARFRPAPKLLIVLDQFEQWLQAQGDEPDAPLVRALRQCDGSRVQALILVRDDFWMAVTRFLRAIEVPLVQGGNAAAVELFDAAHARKVLEEFGRALERIPNDGTAPSDEVHRFLGDVVNGLTAPDGRVTPVRLSLFAEVVRHRPWTRATLQALGGVDGIGVKFLEDRFESESSPYRPHRHAAQAILRALLPPPTSNIRGVAWTASELLAASGYADRPGDFDDLMRVLDHDLRLITPTEEKTEGGKTTETTKGHGGRKRRPIAASPEPVSFPDPDHSPLNTEYSPLTVGDSPVTTGHARPNGEGVPQDVGGEGATVASTQHSQLTTHHSPVHYQLAHDYLIRPVRRWLEREQRSTRAGRARLRLEAITAAWLERPVPRRLPSLLEWIGIISYVRRDERSPDQQRLLRATARHYTLWFAAAAAVITVAVVARHWFRHRETARALLREAKAADDRKLQALIPELEPYRDVLSRDLETDEHVLPSGVPDRELAGVLLFRFEPSAARGRYLRERLLVAPDPDRVQIFRESLAADIEQSGRAELWRVAGDKSAAPGERLRAVAALARLEPTHANWSTIDPKVARALLREDRGTIPRWIELLDPVLAVVVNQLDHDVRDPGLSPSSRASSAEALAEALVRRGTDADFAGPIVEAPPEAFHTLVRALQRMRGAPGAVEALRDIATTALPDRADEFQRDRHASRQASASIALLALGHPEQVWPRLRHAADPRIRCLLIDRLGQFDVNPQPLLDRLKAEVDPVELEGVLLALAEIKDRGQNGLARVPPNAVDGLVGAARDLYLEHPHPAVHSAAELVLSRWGRADLLEECDEILRRQPRRPTGRRWELGPNNHTLIIIRGPLEFQMGSPDSEEERYDYENQHFRRINRSLAVATKEVTIKQFREFDPTFVPQKRYTDAPSCPMNLGNYFRAAAYCNWLSEKAGIAKEQWCYPEEIGPGMIVAEDSVDRFGYRLPTEAEWENLCRAMTETAHPFGESQALFSRYAWTWLNSNDRAQPVGTLLPNELGLFDVLGNVWEWCHDGPVKDSPVQYPAYPPGTKRDPANDRVTTTAVSEATRRLLRGGAFDYSPLQARSAQRYSVLANHVEGTIGFRVVRTLPPGEIKP